MSPQIESRYRLAESCHLLKGLGYQPENIMAIARLFSDLHFCVTKTTQNPLDEIKRSIQEVFELPDSHPSS